MTIQALLFFFSLLAKAWVKSITPENVKSGFRACEICPLNPAQIPKEAYLPCTLFVSDNTAAAASSTGNENTMSHNPAVNQTLDIVSNVDSCEKTGNDEVVQNTALPSQTEVKTY